MRNTVLTEYLTEQEQIELLKNWIKQYSFAIILGVVISIAAISGWRYWQQRQNQLLTQASSLYDAMLTARAQGDTTTTIKQAKTILHDYPKTPYGEVAAFMLARNAVLEKNYREAEKRLHWVIKHSHTPSMRQIARIRLAQILVFEKKPQDALTLLKKVEDKSFSGLIEETKGDAHLAMNNTPLARQSYQQAITELPNAEEVRPLLEMKLEDLAAAH
jgi:predicted negative regulator of RcsB-dependent stress response